MENKNLLLSELDNQMEILVKKKEFAVKGISLLEKRVAELKQSLPKNVAEINYDITKLNLISNIVIKMEEPISYLKAKNMLAKIGVTDFNFKAKYDFYKGKYLEPANEITFDISFKYTDLMM